MTFLDQVTALLAHPNAANLKDVLDTAQPDDLDELLEVGIERLLPPRPSSEQAVWAGQIMREVYARLEEPRALPNGGSLVDMREQEAREIGTALASGLVRAVHDSPRELSEYFGALDARPEPGWWTDLDDISVEAAGEVGSILHQIGMSPLTVAIAAHGIANELRRTYELRELPERDALTVVEMCEPRPRWQGLGAQSPIVAADDLGRQVSFVAGLEPDRGQLLGRWLLRAARRRPRLFDGFDCKGDGDKLFCFPMARVDSLIERWRGS